MLGDDVGVHENVTHDEKVDLMARARALILPIDWPEPFGLVMVEAMACGTPVVVRPLGAAPEIVLDGVTGYVRESVDDLAAAVDDVDRCDPCACRARVEECFSAERMVAAYEQVLASVTTDAD
jgi:glycosyltransferase involved in cell wall biosynthesis